MSECGRMRYNSSLRHIGKSARLACSITASAGKLCHKRCAICEVTIQWTAWVKYSGEPAMCCDVGMPYKATSANPVPALSDEWCIVR